MLKFVEYIKRPSNLGLSLLNHFGTWLPDKEFLKLCYRFKMGKKLNLKNPQTFSEKIQWLKLYNRRPEYTMMVDKYKVKDYVANIIGEQYIIPTIGVWDRPDDIEWDKLPNQFVLKSTNAGGNCGVIICKDKSVFDKESAINKLNAGMSLNLYKISREWPYKNVKPRVIAEEYMEDSVTKELSDFKFFCFDGKVKALFVGTERQKPGEDVKFDFYDENYNHLPFKQGHEHAAVEPAKPRSFELMKIIASKLSKGLPHVRIDLYEVDGKPYFGEMTFFHFAGTTPFEPEEWDYKFGEWLTLPEKNFDQ